MWVSKWVDKWVGKWVRNWVGKWVGKWVSKWVGKWADKWAVGRVRWLIGMLLARSSRSQERDPATIFLLLR